MREYDKKLGVQVSTLSSTDSRAEPDVQVRIDDRASGEVLAEWRMPAGQWWQMVTGLHTTVDGTYSPYLERVGKKLVVEQVKLGRSPAEISRSTEAQKAWAEEQARLRPEFARAEDVCVSRHNYGWGATYRQWEQTHEFEAFDGASGRVCTAMVMRDGAGDSCGLPPEHVVHQVSEVKTC